MSETLLDSDLTYGRMELTADAGSAIAERAVARGRLTEMEARELRLMDIDQEQRRRQWADELRSEGRYVNLLDSSDRKLQTGIRVNALGSGRPAVYVYGEIGAQFGGIIADDFRRGLMEISDGVDIDLHVHSDGGDFYEGTAMHALVSARQGRTFGFVDGRACSAATFPLMACTEITMSVGSRLMIHQSSASLGNGQADEFERAAEMLRETNAAIAAIYLPRWKGSKESLIAALDRETWFTAAEAIAVGLADSVSEKAAIAASVSPRHQYKNIPAPLTIAARAENCPRLMAAGLALHRVAIVR